MAPLDLSLLPISMMKVTELNYFLINIYLMLLIVMSF